MRQRWRSRDPARRTPSEYSGGAHGDGHDAEGRHRTSERRQRPEDAGDLRHHVHWRQRAAKILTAFRSSVHPGLSRWNVTWLTVSAAAPRAHARRLRVMCRSRRVLATLASLTLLLAETTASAPSFGAYRALLDVAVRGASVDYARLARDRSIVDAATRSFDAADTHPEPTWSRTERFAFWINAYNAFTIAAIVDHYPIRRRWFSLAPGNSIRQIDGVWTRLTWRAAGRAVTLDHIEHEILRPAFNDPRVHFAINCASRSCPPIRSEPYAADRLESQLDDSARRYLASPFGLQIDGSRLKVSSIFKWYGEDFVARFAGTGADRTRADRDRAVLGFVAAYGPPAAAALARSGEARVEVLSYDWSLNDLER